MTDQATAMEDAVLDKIELLVERGWRAIADIGRMPGLTIEERGKLIATVARAITVARNRIAPNFMDDYKDLLPQLPAPSAGHTPRRRMRR